MLLNVFIVLVFIHFIAAFQPPWMFMGRPLSGFRQMDTIDNILKPAPQWFDQLLDHFNSKNGIQWKQRYWKNEIYSKPNAPQFLILGGDAPASSDDVIYDKYPHVQYARELNATLWTLEHRFYGESQPFGDLATENLKYLKSRQALADIAHFIKTQNSDLKLTNPKWILFGGSYGGSLAIWFKNQYPELCIGVVASSAALYSKIDFYEYLKHTEDVINNYSPDLECTKNIQKSFKSFTKELAGNKKVLLTSSFPLKPDLMDYKYTYENVSFLYSNIISYFQLAVQYNNVNTNMFRYNISVARLCKIMGEDIHGIGTYRNIASYFQNVTKYLPTYYNSTDINYSEMVEYLKMSEKNDINQASTRAWTWQVCNEFGNFISTNGGRIIFGSDVSYNLYVSICIDVFGKAYSIINTQYGMQFNRKHYGTILTYNATNVIVSRGSDDPWGLLTMTKSNNPTILPYYINGTGHCGDMAPSADNDSESLKQFRSTVLEKLLEWIH